MNLLDPDMMTAEERLAELAAILARGLVRLKARQSRSLFAERGESSLDFPAPQRRHATARNRTETTS